MNMIHSKKVFALHACHLVIKRGEAPKGAASPYAKRGPPLQGVTFYPVARSGTFFPLCPRHVEIDGGLIKFSSFNFGCSLTPKGKTALPFLAPLKMKARAVRFLPLFYKVKSEAQRLCLPSSYARPKGQLPYPKGDRLRLKKRRGAASPFGRFAPFAPFGTTRSERREQRFERPGGYGSKKKPFCKSCFGNYTMGPCDTSRSCFARYSLREARERPSFALRAKPKAKKALIFRIPKKKTQKTLLF